MHWYNYVGTSHVSSLDLPETQESFLYISLDAIRSNHWLNTNLWFYVAVFCYVGGAIGILTALSKQKKRKKKKHKSLRHRRLFRTVQPSINRRCMYLARFCKNRRVKAAKTRLRRYARRCWYARLKPKVDCHRKRKHVYNHAAVWTRLSGGHGGAGSFATKKRREDRQQQATLADMLQNTLNQWMQFQHAPKRQKATAQASCSDTSLISSWKPPLQTARKTATTTWLLLMRCSKPSLSISKKGRHSIQAILRRRNRSRIRLGGIIRKHQVPAGGGLNMIIQKPPAANGKMDIFITTTGIIHQKKPRCQVSPSCGCPNGQ